VAVNCSTDIRGRRLCPGGPAEGGGSAPELALGQPLAGRPEEPVPGIPQTGNDAAVLIQLWVDRGTDHRHLGQLGREVLQPGGRCHQAEGGGAGGPREATSWQAWARATLVASIGSQTPTRRP
jgi:hypothetical protein